MDLIEREYHINLFDTYKELLTDKQKEYFTLHYFDDLSFAEIAEEKNVSRNAAFDQIKKVLHTLEDYEEKLKLLKKSELILEAVKDNSKLKEKVLSIIKE
jgi:predicted DNA-binding protein YlxM (UPF0122 family)